MKIFIYNLAFLTLALLVLWAIVTISLEKILPVEWAETAGMVVAIISALILAIAILYVKYPTL